MKISTHVLAVSRDTSLVCVNKEKDIPLSDDWREILFFLPETIIEADADALPFQVSRVMIMGVRHLVFHPAKGGRIEMEERRTVVRGDNRDLVICRDPRKSPRF